MILSAYKHTTSARALQKRREYHLYALCGRRVVITILFNPGPCKSLPFDDLSDVEADLLFNAQYDGRGPFRYVIDAMLRICSCTAFLN